MRNFLLLMQVGAILLLMFETGFVFINLKNGLQKFLLANSLSTLLNSMGYLVAVQASSMGECLAGVKMSYVGRVWVPFTFLLLVCALCRKKIRKPLFIFLALIHLSVLGLVMTCDLHELYYRNIAFSTSGVFPCLKKDNGIFYQLYHSMILAYIVYGIVILIRSIFREKNRMAKKRLFTVLAAVVAESVFYLIEVAGLTDGFDDTVLGYAIGSIFMCFAIFRYSLLDTLKKTRDYVIDEVAEGVLTIDSDGAVTYCNESARTIFPQLETSASEIVSMVQDSLAAQKPLSVGDRIFTLKERELVEAGAVTGRIFVLIDDTEHQKYTDMMNAYNHTLETEVSLKTEKIKEIQQRTIIGMAQMVESRDLSTGGHIKRTSQVVSVFAKALLKADMGFTPEFLKYVERSAPMHDLGKIAVDDSILRKQSKFTDEEYEVMKRHSAAGARIVGEILTGIEDDAFVEIAVNVAHYHHEKVNGRGYPEGLSGSDIPVEARIMALADVFDALVSKRCYKDAFSFDKAFAIIQEDSGSHFDAELAAVFISCRDELEALYGTFDE